MNKEIKFNKEAKKLILEGIAEITNAVKITLGPKGKNVIIRGDGNKSIITKDGITVAKAIDFRDKYKSIGAEFIKDISESANNISGDGSTTAAVIGYALIKEGSEIIKPENNVYDVKRGIEKAISATIENLKKQAEPINNNIDKIINVATISANGDKEIGTIIGDVMSKVGPMGLVDVEKTNKFETTIDLIKGIKFDQGYMEKDFITDKGRMLAEYKNPLLLFSFTKIKHIDEILEAIKYAVKNKQPLIIITDDIDKNALNLIIENRITSGLEIAVIKSPGFASIREDMIEDLALLTGGTVIKDFEKDDLVFGKAKKIIIKRESTTILGGEGIKSKINKRLNQLKEQSELNDLSDFDKENLRERYAKISSKVAVVNVGGQTEVEMKERMDRIKDALGATKAALEEGIIEGGGTALLRASEEIEIQNGDFKDELVGFDIVKKAIIEPFKQILVNAGLDVKKIDSIKNSVLKGDIGSGYDVTSGICYLKEKGIIDPVKVTRIALEKASSIAGLFITTDAVIIEK